MLISDKLKFNLQFFAADNGADGGAANPDGTNPNGAANPNGTNPEGAAKIEFTKEQQSEIDRMISKATQSAIDKAAARNEEIIAEKVKTAADKAAEYATLTEAQKQQKLLEEREAKITKAENELKTRQLKTQIEADLIKEGLPVSFADMLVKLDTPEQIKETVNALKAQLDVSANDLVKDRLRQATPKNATAVNTGSAGTKNFAKMAAKHRVIGKD